MSISLIHHHLEPGGVTEVVQRSVEAVASHMPELTEIHLVTGRTGGAEDLLARLEPVCSRNGVSINLTIIQDIDYLPAGCEPGGKADQTAETIRRKLLSVCSGSVWMIHNYHLGKNPLLTRALLQIAHNHPEERLCFYIHDFPECSRYENLVFLRRFLSGSPYPVAPNVRYLVINGRDFNYLIQAGIPESHVFLLNNPVGDEDPAGEGRNSREGRETGGRTARRRARRPDLKGDFENRLFEHAQGYVRGAPLLLYPVRTIRRKNVLEMGLICAVSRDPLNLMVTLPGVSESEKGYSDKVERAFSEGLITGIWGIGTRLQDAGFSFHELVSIADVICSSSVQEGFGYLFIHSRLWGIPLLARYLDVLEGIEPAFHGHPSHFYRSLRVPSHLNETESLRKAYAQKARRVESLAGEQIVDAILSEFPRIADGETVDFSYLPVERQLRVLKQAREETGFRDDVLALNGPVFDAAGRFSRGFEGGSKAGPGPQGQDGEPGYWPFSFETYAQTVGKIIASFSQTPELQADERPDVQSRLIRRFASIEYLRLLYDE